MKNTFKAFMTLAAGLLVLASCQKTQEPLASSVAVDVTDYEFVAAGESKLVNVTSDGDWMATAPSWITVDPAYGNGNTEVTLTAAKNYNSYNELQGPKSGKVTFFCGEGSVEVAVTQLGDKALDTRHTYRKVTAVTPGKSYLIVCKDAAGKLQAATPVTGSYGYFYPIEVSEVNGAIELNTGNYAFTVAESAAGAGTYTLQQADKKYIYAKGYNSFNVSATYAADSGYDVTIAFDEKGMATIKTTLENKYIQYSNSYKSYGTYAGPQDGASMPMLYEDSKASTDEVLLVAKTDVSVASLATTETINITASGAWTIYNHASWISLSPTSGTGNAAVTATIAENADYRNSRSAEIIVKGKETSVTVNILQKPIFICKTVADIVSQLTGTSTATANTFQVDFTENKSAVVTYVNGNNVFIQDKTAAVNYYKSGHGLTAGQPVGGKFTATGYRYSGLPELTAITGATFGNANEALIPEPEVVTIATLTGKNFESYLNKMVTIEGVKVTTAFKASSTTAERRGVVSQNGKTLDIFVQIKDGSIDVPVDAEGNLTGIVTVNNTTKQLGLWSADGVDMR